MSASLVLIGQYLQMLECKQAIFPNSRENNSGCSGSISPLIELIQNLISICIVAEFGTDWSIFADARV